MRWSSGVIALCATCAFALTGAQGGALRREADERLDLRLSTPSSAPAATLVAVKVIDIFGADTMALVPVSAG